MRSGLTQCHPFLLEGSPSTLLRAKVTSLLHPPPFCDLSLLFTALCPLDLELQVFTQCIRKRGVFGTCGYYCLYIFISKCLGDSLGGTVLKEKLPESGMEVEEGNALSIAL